MSEPLALTRAANLCDFDGRCASVGQWQQLHAREAVTRWASALDGPRAGRVTVLNYGASPFVVPVQAPVPIDAYDYATPAFFVDGAHAIVFAFSVLDRCAEPRRILRQVQTALGPGGLLVATFALWDAHGEDVAIGHTLRQRIYDRATWKKLIEDARGLGFQTFGGVDRRYPGDTLGDHSLGTLVCVKEGA